ncbi:MAG: hypothetical protein ACJ74Z_21740 [Bryobacteraceae bacterium]
MKAHAALAFTPTGAAFALLTAVIVPSGSLANDQPTVQADNLLANLTDEVRTFSDAAL